MNTIIEDYVSAAEKVPDDALLGQIVWYTISEADVPMEQVKQELINKGLNADLLRPIRPIDAFKLATKELARSFRVEDGVKLNILVRSVGQDGETSHRHVVLERVSTKAGQKRRLIYDSSAEIVYFRGDRTKEGWTNYSLQISRRNVPGLNLSPDQEAWLNQALQDLPDRFKHLSTHMQSHKVRNFVREYLQSLHAVCIKESGGVYFVAQKRRDELTRLGEWVRSISSEFSMTPLLDLMEKRQEIAYAFEQETIAEVERIEKAIAKILEDPKRSIREDTFDEFGRTVAELTSKALEYKGMLGVRGELAKAHIDKVKRQVLQLVDRIDYGKKEIHAKF